MATVVQDILSVAVYLGIASLILLAQDDRDLVVAKKPEHIRPRHELWYEICLVL